MFKNYYILFNKYKEIAIDEHGVVNFLSNKSII